MAGDNPGVALETKPRVQSESKRNLGPEKKTDVPSKTALENSNKDIKKIEKWGTYKPDGEDEGHDKIFSLISVGNKSIVYLYWLKGEECRRLAYDYTSVCQKAEHNGSIAMSLQMRTVTRLPQRRHDDAIFMVASCLGRALEKADDDKEEYLDEAIEYVDAEIRSYVSLWYLGAALVVAAVVSAILFSIPALYTHDYLLPLLGAAFGTLGAFVSLLQRFKDVKIEEYSTTPYIVAGGISRMLLGFIFGALFVILQKAGMVMNVAAANAADNIFVIYALAFVAGISERFIPDLIASKEGSQNNVKSEEVNKSAPAA